MHDMYLKFEVLFSTLFVKMSIGLKQGLDVIHSWNIIELMAIFLRPISFDYYKDSIIL